jgi:hypothetical protein
VESGGNRKLYKIRGVWGDSGGHAPLVFIPEAIDYVFYAENSEAIDYMTATTAASIRQLICSW